MLVKSKRNFSAGRVGGQLLSFEEGKKYEVSESVFKKVPFGSFEKIQVIEEEEGETSGVNESKKRGRKPKE
jgi:hypothetical protein